MDASFFIAFVDIKMFFSNKPKGQETCINECQAWAKEEAKYVY